MSSVFQDISKYQFFPPTYAVGRDWFEAAVAEVGGQFRRYQKPHHAGPDGGELSIDVGWIGRPDAPKVFVSLSGVHGQEYFCGAAGQMHWLSAGPPSLDEDVAICLVHAVNPYGAAYFTRTNEDKVDLNRNFRDHSVPRPTNAVFDKVAASLSLHQPFDFAFYDIVEKFNRLMVEENPLDVMTAIAGGQSMQPDGMAYCGVKPGWEITTLTKIASDFLGQARQIAIIDWHTGLGPSGKASVLCDLPAASPGFDKARQWWGAPQRTDALYESGEAPDIEGEVRDGLSRLLSEKGADVVQTVVEIGTVDNRAIIPAFAIDRWLRTQCADHDPSQTMRLRTIMMERYNPSSPEWREKALTAMAALYRSTVQGLSGW